MSSTLKSVLVVFPLIAVLASCSAPPTTRHAAPTASVPAAAANSVSAPEESRTPDSNPGARQAVPATTVPAQPARSVAPTEPPNSRYPNITMPEGARECPYLSLADIAKIMPRKDVLGGESGEIVGTGPSVGRKIIEQLLILGCSYNDAFGQFVSFQISESLADPKASVFEGGTKQMEPKIGLASTMIRGSSPKDPVTIRFALRSFHVTVTAKDETDSADLALKAARLLSWHLPK